MTDNKDNHHNTPPSGAETAADRAGDQDAKDGNGKSGREEWGEVAKTALIAVLLALIIRTFFYEPFNIPSGSMRPTLLVGDYLFVSKTTYGYSRYSFPFGLASFEGRMWKDMPARGDVVVFKKPGEEHLDFIKRVVGLPGDTIEMVHGRLLINGKRLPREPVGMRRYKTPYGQGKSVMEYLVTLPGGITHAIYEESDNAPLDNTPRFTVPGDHIFVMGDNRDNSRDSRAMREVGFVPVDNIVGKAAFLFFSTNGTARFYEFWNWPWTIRYSRLFKTLEPVKVEGSAPIKPRPALPENGKS